MHIWSKIRRRKITTNSIFTFTFLDLWIMDTISHSCLRAAQYQNSFSREHFSLSLFVRHVYETSNWWKSTLTQQDRLFIFQYQNSFYWKHLFSFVWHKYETSNWQKSTRLIKCLYFRVSRNYSISPALDRYWTSFDKCNNFSATLR